MCQRNGIRFARGICSQSADRPPLPSIDRGGDEQRSHAAQDEDPHRHHPPNAQERRDIGSLEGHGGDGPARFLGMWRILCHERIGKAMPRSAFGRSGIQGNVSGGGRMCWLGRKSSLSVSTLCWWLYSFHSAQSPLTLLCPRLSFCLRSTGHLRFHWTRSRPLYRREALLPLEKFSFYRLSGMAWHGPAPCC